MGCNISFNFKATAFTAELINFQKKKRKTAVRRTKYFNDKNVEKIQGS